MIIKAAKTVYKGAKLVKSAPSEIIDGLQGIVDKNKENREMISCILESIEAQEKINAIILEKLDRILSLIDK